MLDTYSVNPSPTDGVMAHMLLTQRESRARGPSFILSEGLSSLPAPPRIEVSAQRAPVTLSVEWTGPEPSWLRPALEVLVELRTLPRNWNSYGALPIADRAIQVAIALLHDVMPERAPHAQIVPTAPGGVQLEWHTGGIDMEIEVEPNGEASVICEDLRTGEEWEGRFPACRNQTIAVLAGLVTPQ